jgi:hypothetical protein
MQEAGSNMIFLSSMIGKGIELDISGNIERVGMLVDYGLDLVVIYDGNNYVYIPFGHIQNIRLHRGTMQTDQPSAYERSDADNELSYRKILMESKGMFVQIFVAGNQSIHGYVTSVMTNYFVFYSPAHQTLFIPMFHLKWLIPYPENQTPYTLRKEELPVQPTSFKLARTFEEQIKKFEGNIVMFDLGSQPDKIGLLKGIQNNIAELVTADQRSVYWNIHHIKMVNSPNLKTDL